MAVFREKALELNDQYLQEDPTVRIRKLDRAYHLPKNICNKKLMDTGARLTRLCASENLSTGNQGQVSQLEERMERRMLRKVG